MNKLIFTLLAALILPFCSHAIKVSDIENVHKADRSRFVSDMAGVLSTAERTQADSLLSSIWQSTSAEPVVVIIPSLDGEDENEFATELFTNWGIGKSDKDNGLLLLVSMDDRRVVIRTGYGLEGLIPDILASKIIRNEIAPAFRNEQYGRGIINAVTAISQAVGSEEARRELQSKYANDSRTGDEDEDFFKIYLILSAVAAVIMLLVVLFTWTSSRKLPTATAYKRLQSLKLPLAVVTVAALLMPAPALILLLLLMRHVRLHKRLCPNCHTRMKRVDEDNDNLYLTPSQDAEERLDSVDYDVWLCPSCGETDIIPYVNPAKNYIECPRCRARAGQLIGQRTLVQPTESREGRGVSDYTCLNCRHRWQKPYNIAKAAAAPIVIVPGRGFGGGGGGGFSGGSFGGGMTGGGGASGGW